MPKREPGITEQLKKAREKQARVMKRFSQAQARLAQVEARLQSLDQRPNTSQPVQGQEAHSQPETSPKEEKPSTTTVEITREQT